MSVYFIFTMHESIDINLLSYKVGYLAGQGLAIRWVEDEDNEEE